MLTHTNVDAAVLLTATALMAGLFAYLQRVKRQLYLQLWALGWGLLVLHYAAGIFQPAEGGSLALAVLSKWLIACVGLTLFCAAQIYVRQRPWKGAAMAAGAVFGVWIAAFALGAVPVSPQFGIAAVFFATAWIFCREGLREEAHADQLIAAALVAWGATALAKLSFGSFTGSNTYAMLTGVPQFLTAVLLVMVVYEEESRRVQRNILGLSNLILATSNFRGEEIEKTLAQALDRVLNVARLEAGFICLDHEDADRSTEFVSAGLDGSLRENIREGNLDREFTRLVARAGGLVVIGDRLRHASTQPIERESGFQSVRDIVLRQGLRTIAAISLQTKDAPFGVLLVASAARRRFTQGELRLLLALGQQIGIALENSRLAQQTSRRSEELAALNEIGRALSSTLDLDDLFEKIFAALQRMFDVKSFYIALHDPLNNQVRFEIEISDGIRLPKRTRAVGNHLTEYIIRTRQPLLFRENLLEEAAKLGVHPVHPVGSFCGVPLLAYDRVVGVMAVREIKEGLLDERHLEMMRVLASEASVAIENARLFREEQTKSRHLTLLNNISRDAITTLNPDEMLANIAMQLEEGLSFDHIGIALLDYACKELVIQVEAGRRRGALGRHLPLEDSLVGGVARTGQMCIARDLAAAAAGAPVLKESASAVALPILYADQLHGVLYVETSEPADFTDEEILLLQTLSDLVSSALHSAFAFQKAQEQAITDGLTGVKTHRFLMEALSAEWKRSTRASRPFSLVLIDLDRFKFINDFYGHMEGDLVLHRVGHILEQSCRRSDVVARYGGDEFVILMPETTAEQGLQLARKLRSAIFTDVLLREKNVSASLGIATFPDHGSTPQELIQVADASMYLSKHQGGNDVSVADHFDAGEAKKWKRDVLEAYLGVTLKRMFSTGPEAYAEIRARLEQFAQSLGSVEASVAGTNGHRASEDSLEQPAALPPAVIETVSSLALAIDSKDHYTQGHSHKVAAYSAVIAEALGMREDEVGEVRLGGMLHDIGKVGIPEEILNKNGPLNPDEWETMKQHVRFGSSLLEPLRAIGPVREMVCHHHEMFDGSGYPDGLMGEQIPLGARIIAIADAFDTITSERTYKKARTPAAGFAELERCAGTQFDPALVRIFVETVQSLPHPPFHGAVVSAPESAR